MLEDLLARSAQPLDEIKANIYQILVVALHCSSNYPTSSPSRSPLRNLALAWHLSTNDLIAIQQTQGIECLLQLAHGVHGIGAQLVGEVVALDEADAVLARGGAFELERALDHVVHEVLGLLVLGFAVVEDDG